MNNTLLRGLAAAIISVGFASTSQATPFYVDFSGTITSSSLPAIEGAAQGLTITGGFNFESDRLYRSESGTTGVAFVDWQPTGLTEPLAFLNFGTRDIQLPAFGGSNYSALIFNDNCTAGSCPYSDSLNLYAYSSSQPVVMPADFSGSYHSASIIFIPGVISTNNLEFDVASVQATDILTLPLNGSLGIYFEEDVSCLLGSCSTSESRQFAFNVDSVTRGMGSRDVPEPGTPGLFALAFAGLLLMRRRAAARASAR